MGKEKVDKKKEKSEKAAAARLTARQDEAEEPLSSHPPAKLTAANGRGGRSRSKRSRSRSRLGQRPKRRRHSSPRDQRAAPHHSRSRQCRQAASPSASPQLRERKRAKLRSPHYGDRRSDRSPRVDLRPK